MFHVNRRSLERTSAVQLFSVPGQFRGGSGQHRRQCPPIGEPGSSDGIDNQSRRRAVAARSGVSAVVDPSG